MTTNAQFDEAAELLLGSTRYQKCLQAKFNRHDICREIAMDHLVDALASNDVKALDLVRAVAARLWHGDGVTGLTD